MKKLRSYFFALTTFALIILLVPHYTFADWTVVASYTIPGKASGLAWDGEFIYFGIYGSNGDEVYKFTPTSGSSELLFLSSDIEDTFGMTYDGSNLWILDHANSSSLPAYAMKFDFSGNKLSQFDLPDHYMSGIASDDDNFWVCTYYPDPGTIYKVDALGTILSQFNSPDEQPWDICKQDDFLWIAEYNNDLLYKIDQSGNILESHAAENIKPAGIVYDGQFLWYVDGQLSSNSTLYKIDLSGSGTPQIELPVTEYNFGNVAIGDSAVWNCTVNNTGTDDLEITNLVVQNAVPIFHYMGFPIIIEPGNSFDLELLYKPTESGPLYTVATIESNDPINSEVELILEGDAVYAGPHINVVNTSHNYGMTRLNAMTRWFIEITNDGSEILEISDINIDIDQFLVDNNLVFPLQINTLETAQIGIWFNPNETGNISGIATILHNDISQPAIEVTLQGDGVFQDYPIGDQFWNYTINTTYDNSIKALTPVADVNGDNIDDVIICSEDDYIRCYNGNSDGLADILWENETGTIYQQNGITTIEDINNDGVDDVIAGLAWGVRAIKALSGKTGEQLWIYDTHVYGDGGWVYQVWAGFDYNNDGTTDVLAATGNDGNNTGPKRIFCLNGLDGELIWDAYTNGPNFSVLGVEDFTGDGLPDVIGGAANNGETEGKVYGINGSTGNIEWEFSTIGTSVWAVEQLDDANGDGVKDIIAGDFSGYIYFIDPTNGSSFETSMIFNVLILRFEKMQDVNADGYADISVAHSGTNAIMINGHNNQPIWFTPLADKCWSVDKIKDINGDDINDLVCGTLYSNNYAYFLDGSTGEEIHSINYSEAIDAICAMPDINNDGSWEMVVGGREGKLTCYSGGLNSSALNADFVADSTYGHQPFTVNFSDLSVGDITSWKWDFDNDGTIDSEEQNPSYTYEELGVFSVALIVSNELASDTLIKHDYILVDLGPSVFEYEGGLTVYANPNPFSSSTIVTVEGITNSTATLTIYNSLGTIIRTLEPVLSKNNFIQFNWRRDNYKGATVDIGLYIGMLEVKNKRKVIKFIVQ